MERSSFYRAGDGTNIWYGTVGQGPPLVLCDGLACDGFIWPYVIDHFVDEFMVVRWHYRGHGLSGRPDDIDSFTIEQLCADLRGVLRELEVDSAVLAGHSMGVQVLLQYFDLYPEQVDALVPICGSYKRPLDTLHNTTVFRDALPYLERVVEMAPGTAQTVWRSLVNSKFSLLFTMATEVNARLARGVDFAPYLEHVAGMDVREFLALLKAVGEHSAEEILALVDVPTLVIAGENDAITPLYRSREMVEAIADSELVVLPGGTHVGPIELPDLVNGAIEKFLARSGLRPSHDAAE